MYFFFTFIDLKLSFLCRILLLALFFSLLSNVWLFYSHDIAKALNILKKDLKDFAPGNEELFKELAQLLTLDDIRYQVYTGFLISEIYKLSIL